MRTGLFMIVPSISLPCFSRARVVLVMGGVCLKCKLQLTDSIGGMTMYTSRRSDQNRKFVRFEAIVLIPIQVRSHLHSPFRHLGHRYRYCVGDSAMITYLTSTWYASAHSLGSIVSVRLSRQEAKVMDGAAQQVSLRSEYERRLRRE